MRQEDLQQAFQHSLFLYKNNPVFCLKVPGDDLLDVIDLKTRQNARIVFSEAFIKPPPGRLGYVNSRYGCVYITRSPRRQWKIGLCKTNTELYWDNFKTLPGHEETYMGIERFHHEAFIPAIRGEYPSFNEALRRVMETKIAVAFDRMFCITPNLSIQFRGKQIVGGVKNDAIIFKPKFQYLEAHLKGNYCESIRNL